MKLVSRQDAVIRNTGATSLVLLGLLSLATVCPLYNVSGTESAEAAVGTSQDSTITFTAARTTASASLETISDSGSFATSSEEQKASFSITTNNYTGYELKIKSSADDALTNSSVANNPAIISPISDTEGITSDEFANNTWGFLPSYYNNTENSEDKYYPITTSDVTLRKTSSANTNDVPDIYTIGLGIKADYDAPAGTYTNDSLVLTYVANPVTYAITYDKGNTTDEVTNLPTFHNDPADHTQSGEVSASSIILSSTVPERTGYDFTGWCLGAISTDPTTKVDSCVNDTTNGITAKTFQPGGTFGIDQTTTNNATLYAMWSAKTFTITVQDGGNTTVAGSGTYKYGDVITITATPTSGTACEAYSTPVWTAKQTADASQDGTGILSSTSGTSITYTVGLTDDTLIATSTKTDANPTITLSRNTGASGIKIDGVNYTSSSVSLSCGNHTIDGTYSSGYDFDGWSRTNGVAFDSASGTSSSTPAGIITVTGNGKLTLYTKSCIAVSGNMQSFSPTAGTCSYGTLTDSRDSKTYTVREINGQWWMTSNLNLAGGTVLSSDKSDVPSSNYYTLPTSTTISSGTSVPSGQFSSDSTAYVFNTGNNTNNCTDSAPCNSYYSWLAATAGGKDSSGNAITTNGYNAAYSICPKGWRLPTATTSNASATTSPNWETGDWYQMIIQYMGGATSLNKGHYDNTDPNPFLTNAGPGTTPNFLLAGLYYSGSFSNGGSYGAYWSSTASSSSNAYGMYFASSYVGSANSGRRSYGFSVRCVFKDRTLSDITTMQEATPSVISNTAEGVTRTLTDSRDSKTYTVKKINGQLWMTQNLRFTETSLNSTTSNTTSNKTLTYYSLASTDSSYDGHCDARGHSYACIKDSGSTTTGVWYNFYAASAGTIKGNSNSNDATQDICPKGWRLPTGSNTTSDTDLNKLVGNTNSGWQAATSGLTAFGAVTGGQYSNGVNDNSSYEANTKSGYWWSATASSPFYRYHLSYNSSDGKFNSNIVADRYYGDFIRCVSS